jgi:CheY-like chemotaxis protein
MKASISTTRRSLAVLVVDDLKDSADSLALILRMEGHDAHSTYDGRSAVDLVREWQPDVIILDICMPGMDGYETARRIRELSPGSKPYLIALTAYGSDADRLRSRVEGFDVHLVKPVDHDVLQSHLARLVPRDGRR